MKKFKKGDKKLIRAWATYDWANSVYALVISSAIFPIYYGTLLDDSDTIPIFGMEIRSTALISFVTGLSILIVTLITPILSGVADYIGNKRIFMKIFVYLGSISCIGLYWFDIENIELGITFYGLALMGFTGSLVFYNSYLPDITYPDQMDKASAKGFTYGYVGSVILLVFNLVLVMYPHWFGISGTERQQALKAMKIAFVSVGIWWVLFSQISLYALPKGIKKVNKIEKIFVNGFRELFSVWKQSKQLKGLNRFLSSFFIYSMALQTVLIIAAYFGEQEINWISDSQKTMGLIISILLIQLVAIIGAELTARASGKFGNIRVLIALNIFWAIICIAAYQVYDPIHFYIIAGCVGLVMGGLQALSRSTYSKLIPKTKDTTSFFSFYEVTEKVGVIIGLVSFGFLDQITGSLRSSITFFLIVFLIGAILLLRIPKTIRVSLQS
ncbi:MAG: MFS transporter [Flavobacteriaceae bacterium]|nr:MFS transporter [Flavobacteriaceae bacterium]MCY4253405.1 MFS transporter [Flavobacteriaceae bacterium]